MLRGMPRSLMLDVMERCWKSLDEAAFVFADVQSSRCFPPTLQLYPTLMQLLEITIYGRYPTKTTKFPTLSPVW